MEPNLDFHNAFFDYLLGSKEYSHEQMGLDEMRQLYDEKVIYCDVL